MRTGRNAIGEMPREVREPSGRQAGDLSGYEEVIFFSQAEAGVCSLQRNLSGRLAGEGCAIRTRL